jgi:hypothetical protein
MCLTLVNDTPVNFQGLYGLLVVEKVLCLKLNVFRMQWSNLSQHPQQTDWAVYFSYLQALFKMTVYIVNFLDRRMTWGAKLLMYVCHMWVVNHMNPTRELYPLY